MFTLKPNGDIDDGSYEQIVTCPHCGKKYIQEVEDQMPGFRMRDYDICPYCKANNGSSLEFEYRNYKISEEN